jgi:integrase
MTAMKPPRRAAVLTMEQLDQLLHYVAAYSRQPLRDYACFLLSFKAGLRAQEIAGLDWEDVFTPTLDIADAIEVPSDIAKNGKARRVPMHPALKATLQALRQYLGPERTRPSDPIIRSAVPVHGGITPPARVSPDALQRYMSRVATHAGLHGVTSHSGRRTFITKAIRNAPFVGASLFDVQRIVGHAFADATAAYVESSEAWDELVRRV